MEAQVVSYWELWYGHPVSHKEALRHPVALSRQAPGSGSRQALRPTLLLL